jgi:outer membrane protein OmpA-like peptidoglycan-associated protein
LNEGTACISGDGKTLVFTRCNVGNDRKSDCDLYISFKEGGIWSVPKNMGSKINSPYWDSQPSLSADGKLLFFSSRRPGGYGEEDIWSAVADENFNWSNPINLGDIINTKGREVAPFIHPNQSTLYFASDYHMGFGNFDIFVSYKDSVNWQTPINLGYPINTHKEESSIFISADGKKAYFSGETKTDLQNDAYVLYEFELPTHVGIKNKSTYAKGVVSDIETSAPLDAYIEVINLKNNTVESKLRSDKITGEYLVVLNENTQYGLFVSKTGYLFRSKTFDFVNEMNFDPIVLDIALQPIKSGMSIVLNNVFFKTGEYELDKKSIAELSRLVQFLNQNIHLKVEISGHTDDVGQQSDNLILSKKRAESVVDFLIENGIDASRIIAVGYGDTKPAVPNNSAKNRKLNRRIECKIL